MLTRALKTDVLLTILLAASCGTTAPTLQPRLTGLAQVAPAGDVACAVVVTDRGVPGTFEISTAAPALQNSNQALFVATSSLPVEELVRRLTADGAGARLDAPLKTAFPGVLELVAVWRSHNEEDPSPGSARPTPPYPFASASVSASFTQAEVPGTLRYTASHSSFVTIATPYELNGMVNFARRTVVQKRRNLTGEIAVAATLILYLELPGPDALWILIASPEQG